MCIEYFKTTTSYFILIQSCWQSHLGDLRVEVLHVVTEHLSEPTEDFLVPGVILQVHLGLDLDSRGYKMVNTRFNKCFSV